MSRVLKGGDFIARGCAKNTEQAREYLMSCAAVSYFEVQGDIITFGFDPALEPTSGVPEGVWFDITEPAF
jgi:hypothetical protein